jgi:hypothetical protein
MPLLDQTIKCFYDLYATQQQRHDPSLQYNFIANPGSDNYRQTIDGNLLMTFMYGSTWPHHGSPCYGMRSPISMLGRLSTIKRYAWALSQLEIRSMICYLDWIVSLLYKEVLYEE